MTQSRPNFLIIITDQMRADHMGCDGNRAIRTPHLDRLAAEGVHLRRAYANCPLCMPGRATLFTGLTPRGHRVRTNGICLDPALPTVPGELAAAGYRTASIGKIHLTSYGYGPIAPPEHFPPQRFPELLDHWKSGRIDHVPTPFYGLEHVEITLGHGEYVLGDYGTWLARQHPEQWRRLMTTPPAPSPHRSEGCGTFPLAEPFHHTTYVAERTIAYLRQCDGARPFFLMCSFPDPHHPYCPPQPWDRMYSPDDVVTPVAREGELDDLAPFFRQIRDGRLQLSGRSNPTRMAETNRREIVAHTYGMVSQIDRQIGRILQTLEQTGLAQNTVVLFASDHGDLMGDHGLLNKGPFHFEGLLRVPMIWRWPGHLGARASAALASLLDVPPTILDLAGVAVPAGPWSADAPPAWPGRSLAPLLRGKQPTVQDSVVIENDEDYLRLRLRTLVTATHKITTYTGPRGPEPYGELFDLQNDPHELHNLWASPSHRPLRAELIERLHHRLVETDPALPRRLAHA